MNKSYKIIFNKNTGKKEVVSELAKNKNGLVKSVSAVGLLSSILLANAFGQTYYDYSGVTFGYVNPNGTPPPIDSAIKDYNTGAKANQAFVVEGGKFTMQNGAVLTSSASFSYIAIRNNDFVLDNSTIYSENFYVSSGVTDQIDAGEHATLLIKNGGVLRSTEFRIGEANKDGTIGTALVVIDGVGSKILSENSKPIRIGEGPARGDVVTTLVIKNGASLEGGAAIQVGAGSRGDGVLVIGGNPYENEAATATGTVISKGIQLGIGEKSKIVFNHTSDDYKFNNKITGQKRSNDSMSIELLAGRTIFTENNSRYGYVLVDNSAILQLGDGGETGEFAADDVTGEIRLSSKNSQLVFDRSNEVTHSGLITGLGTVVKKNNTTLVFDNNNTYTGTTTVEAGTLQLGDGGTTGALAGNVVLKNGATLSVERSDLYEFKNDISGQGNFVQEGLGTTTLSGNNTYTGVTNINRGTLALGKDNAISTASSNVTIDSGATLSLAGKQQSLKALTNKGTVNLADGQLTLNGNSSSTSAQGLTGNGTLIVQNGDFNVSATNNTFNANIMINKGTSATLIQSGNLGSGNIDLSGALNLSGTNAVSNQISGSGAINTKSTAVASLMGNNSGFTGNHNIEGSLTVSKQQNLGKGLVDLISTTSTLILNGVQDAISNTIQGKGAVDVTNNAKTSLTADNSAFTGVYNIKSGSLSVKEQKNLGDGLVNLTAQQSQLVLDGVKSTISSKIQGSGNVNITNNANTKLTANNSSFAGTISVASGSKLTVDAQNQLGTGQVANSGNVIFDNYAQGAKSTLTNSFSGSGAIDLTNSSLELTSTKNFSGVTGNINVNANSNLYVSANNQINVGSTINLNDSANLNINSTSALTWDRKAAGQGSINIDTAGKAINFGSNFGNTFAGTVNLKNSVFEIKGNDAKALTNATLVVSSGNTTNISGNDQSIGNLTMNGGTLEFGVASQGNSYNDLFARLNVKDLKTGSAGQPTIIKINASKLPQNPNVFDPGLNLLNHAHAPHEILIEADYNTLDMGKIVLQDLDGTELNAKTDISIYDVNNPSLKVAKGTYNYGLTDERNNDDPTLNGLGFTYALTQIDILDGQTVVLNTAGSNPNPNSSNSNREMEALISGKGNLTLMDADNLGIILDHNNTYTGVTTVQSGTVIVGNNNGLGQTSSLNINAGTVRLDGRTQTIGALKNNGKFEFEGGELTISGGGSSITNNGLSGEGTLKLSGGELKITGANSKLSTAIEIGNGADLTLFGLGTVGMSEITLADSGALNLYGTPELNNTLYGTGDVNVKNTLSITGENTDFEGTFNIDSANLTIAKTSALGKGTVNVSNLNSTLTLSDVQGELTNDIQGTGVVSLENESLIYMKGDNSAFNGSIDIDKDAQLAVNAQNSLGNASINNNNELWFDNYEEGKQTDLSNKVIGSGAVNLVGSHLALTATNNFSNVTGSINIDNASQLNVSNSNQLNADSALLGAGALNINTGAGNAFNFSANVGTSFTGRVNLGEGTFALGGNNTKALTNATLVTGVGSDTTVVLGAQTVGNVVLDGGAISFDQGHTIATDQLSTGNNITNIRVDLDDIDKSGGASSNLFDQNIGDNQQLIVAKDNLKLSIDKLNLQNALGNNLGTGEVQNIKQGNSVVAEGTYNYELTTDNGLGATFALTQLNILDGQTLLLDSTGAVKTTKMDALIIGTGDLVLTSDAKGLTLDNAGNSYSGTTTVTSNTKVTAGSDNAFGNTSSLGIEADAIVDLAGKNQTVGSLANEGTLSLGGGALTLENGGSSMSANGLTGTGTLTVEGGDFAVSNVNNNLSATVNVDAGATTTLTGTGNLGTGEINLAGGLNLNGNNSVGNTIKGAGTITTGAGATATLTGNNSGFTGSHSINGGTLTVHAQNNLGSGNVTLADAQSSLNLANAKGGISNNIAGSGNVNLVGSDVRLTGTNTKFTGGLSINQSSHLAITEQANLGGSTIKNDGALTFDHFRAGATANLNNSISGKGNINLVGTDLVLSDKHNFGNVTGAINIDKTSELNVSNSNQLNGSSALQGSGTLNVDTNGNAFNFGVGAGKGFTGQVNLVDTKFEINANNASAVSNATLSLGDDSLTVVSGPNLAIGNMEFNAGTIVIQTDVTNNVLTTKDVSIISQAVPGTLRKNGESIKLSGIIQTNDNDMPAADVVEKLNILDKEDLTGAKTLIKITDNQKKVASLNLLELEDLDGNEITESKGLAIVQHGKEVADAVYDYKIVGILNADETRTEELAAHYGLLHVTIRDGEDFELDTGSSTGNDLDVEIKGDGNLVIKTDDDKGLNINVDNSDLNGNVTIDSGTVNNNSNNGLGNGNGDLTINDDGTLNLGGNNQDANNVNNNGNINTGDGGSINAGGDINNNEGGAIDLGNGGQLVGDGNLNNNGDITSGDNGVINVPGILDKDGNLVSGGNVNNNGNIDLGNNGNLNAGNDINNNEGGTIDLGNGGQLVGDGNLNNNGDITSGDNGVINVPGILDKDGNLVSGGNVNNNGNIDLGNNGNLNAGNDINNNGGGTIDLGNGGQLVGNGNLNNKGDITIDSGGSIDIDNDINNYENINLGENGSLTAGNNINNHNPNGVIDLGTGGTLTAGNQTKNDGLIKGDGNINGGFTNNGTVEVGSKNDGSSGELNFNNGLMNNGDIYISRPGDNSVGNQLVVNGNYTGGKNSSIYMSVDLGNDTTSRVDKMIVTGHAGGSTQLYVHDLGKVTGDMTSQLGVKLIEVGSSDKDAFVLQNTVIKGAYEYTLHRNDADQDWYMTSYGTGGGKPVDPGTPNARPDVGNIFGNVGNIINSQVPGYGGSSTQDGMPGGLGGLASLDRLMTEDGRYLGSVWSSNTASKNKGRALHDTIHFSSNTYSTVLGADTGFTSGQSLWIVGAKVGLGKTDTDSTNRNTGSKTKSDVTSTTFGLYGTMYLNYQDLLSPYVSASATYSKFDNTIKTRGNPNYKYDSHATVVTLKGGYPLDIGNGLVLEPQGQLSYVNYKSKNYVDHVGTKVKENLDGNMIYRAGVFVYPQDGDFKPYGGVNLWYDSIRTKVSYDGVAFKSDKTGFSYEAKVGFNYQATKNFSVSTEFNYMQGKSHKRDYSANIGFKYQF